MLFTDVSHERAVRAFKKAGFWVMTHRGNNHTIMSNGTAKIAIPRHPRLHPYTLKRIIHIARLTDEEFKKLL